MLKKLRTFALFTLTLLLAAIAFASGMLFGTGLIDPLAANFFRQPPTLNFSPVTLLILGVISGTSLTALCYVADYSEKLRS